MSYLGASNQSTESDKKAIFSKFSRERGKIYIVIKIFNLLV